MPEVAKTIRQWLGGLRRSGGLSQEEAARTQLQGHLDTNLLEAFFQRDVSPEQYQTIINHLNGCDPCREAIALVLLAVDDPKAAAELERERKRRLEQESEAWWKQAVRWSMFAIVGLGLVLAVLVVSRPGDSESSDRRSGNVGSSGLFGGASRDSSTSFGEVVTSRYEKPAAVSRPATGKVLRQPGWDTGPAPYAGNIAPSAPYKEVELYSGDRRDEREEPAAVKTAPEASAAPATVGSGKASARNAKRRLVVGEKGELKRTLDGGATWQDVIVGPNLVFRSLALSGRTVWATGNAGALYRSLDAAEHWQPVRLQYRGDPITDDLVDIEFTDPQHGRIRSATGREWVTVDGGNQWVLNPWSTASK